MNRHCPHTENTRKALRQWAKYGRRYRRYV